MDFKSVVIFVLYTVSYMCFGNVVLEHNNPSAEVDTFVCGRGATFTCNINPAPTLMTWIKDTDTLTNCPGATDGCFDLTKANYQFSSNVSIDEYYMKVNPVKLTDETTFTCNNGAGTADSKMISVATLPSIISLTETGSDNVTLQVTTDCVYPLSSVSIEWYYIMDIGGTPEVYDFKPVKSDDNSSCTSGDCTSGVGVSQLTSSIYFEENSEYTDVYLFAKVKHSAAVNEPEVNATTSKKYRILEGPKPGPRCLCWWGVYYDTDGEIGIIVICWIALPPMIALILYIAGIIIGGILTITRCCCRGFYHCKDSDCCECCQGCGKNKYVTCACCASLPCGVCCNIAGLPFWVQVLWSTIIGAPVALGIYTVWKCCGKAKPEKKNPEEQPMTDIKTDD